jgi:hypothetical protein
MVLLQHHLQNTLPQPQPFTNTQHATACPKLGGTLPLDATCGSCTPAHIGP